MNIFISYPRELVEKARLIASEPTDLANNIFIDEDSIGYSEEWKKSINEGLKKSDIFIILYNLDKEETGSPGRFIKTEIDLIIKEIKNKPKKKLLL